jgi:hypothetical protein
MNHTGVCGTGSRRQARTKAESAGLVGVTSVTRDMVPCGRTANKRGAAIDDGQR